MIELPDGTVFFRWGEIAPSKCGECGKLYYPWGDGGCTACPHCGHLNEANDGAWSLVEAPTGSDGRLSPVTWVSPVQQWVYCSPVRPGLIPVPLDQAFFPKRPRDEPGGWGADP